VVLDFDRLPRGYQLLWPHELLRDELTQILDRGPFVQLADQLRLLFEEAFVGPGPVDDVPGAGFSGLDAAAFQHGLHILNRLDELQSAAVRRYFKQRKAPVESSSPVAMSRAQRELQFQSEANEVLRELDANGYFHQGMEMSDCVDDEGPGHAQLMRRHIAQRGGPDITWPPVNLTEFPERALTPEDCYTLLEILHDTVARPRSVQWHDFDDHAFYSNFDQRTGEAVLQWRINTLFDRCQLDFTMAAEGPDRGFVVSTVRDPRAELEAQVTTDTVDTTENNDLVTHAIALFRKRDSTAQDKRSACKDLADVLEHRRPLIKEHLPSKDEGLIFEIANKYWVRHHDASQHADYGEEFLDWIFWNFLSAIELTNRILARNAAPEAAL